jgi:hypothetical protein
MDEIAKLSDEDFEEYREMFQDILALRGDIRIFYTPDKELSDAIYDISEPLDALFKILHKRMDMRITKTDCKNHN